MANIERETTLCPLCHQEKPPSQQIPGVLIPGSLMRLIQQKNPAWTRNDVLCDTCLNQAKMRHAQTILQAEKGWLSELDRDVLASIGSQGLVSTNPTDAFEQTRTWAERLSDRVTASIGSWYFSSIIFLFLAGWISLNLLFQPFDPYPVIILAVISAVLGSLAAIQGPIILMSQRRQTRLDRLRAENDYRLNLKAELEIRYLSEKMDHLFTYRQKMEEPCTK